MYLESRHRKPTHLGYATTAKIVGNVRVAGPIVCL